MEELCIIVAGGNKTMLPSTILDGILVNVADDCVRQQDLHHSKNIFKKGKKNILDSGGYTIFTYEKDKKGFISDPALPIIKNNDLLNLAPVHVIESALFLNPHIVMALDYPINFADGPAAMDIEFKKKVGYNIMWAWECARLKEKYNLESLLFLPIQAFNINQFKQYWGHVKDIEPDGVSLPVRHLTLKEVALFLMYFYQIGIKRVHILGSTTPQAIVLSAYFAKHYFEFISLDSTSWLQATKTKRFINPHDLSVEYFGNTLMDGDIENDCTCIYCKDQSFLDINDLDDTEKTYFLGWHNILATENFGRQVFKQCDNVNKLSAYLKKKIQPKHMAKMNTLCNILSIFEVFPNLPIHDLYDLIDPL